MGSHKQAILLIFATGLIGTINGLKCLHCQNQLDNSEIKPESACFNADVNATLVDVADGKGLCLVCTTSTNIGPSSTLFIRSCENTTIHAKEKEWVDGGINYQSCTTDGCNKEPFKATPPPAKPTAGLQCHHCIGMEDKDKINKNSPCFSIEASPQSVNASSVNENNEPCEMCITVTTDAPTSFRAVRSCQPLNGKKPGECWDDQGSKVCGCEGEKCNNKLIVPENPSDPKQPASGSGVSCHSCTALVRKPNFNKDDSCFKGETNQAFITNDKNGVACEVCYTSMSTSVSTYYINRGCMKKAGLKKTNGEWKEFGVVYYPCEGANCNSKEFVSAAPPINSSSVSTATTKHQTQKPQSTSAPTPGIACYSCKNTMNTSSITHESFCFGVNVKDVQPITTIPGTTDPCVVCTTAQGVTSAGTTYGVLRSCTKDRDIQREPCWKEGTMDVCGCKGKYCNGDDALPKNPKSDPSSATRYGLFGFIQLASILLIFSKA